MKLQEAIRLRILELCQNRKTTVGRLCVECGITPSTLHNITSGRNRSTTLATIQRLCVGLEISLPAFFDSEYFDHLEL